MTKQARSGLLSDGRRLWDRLADAGGPLVLVQSARAAFRLRRQGFQVGRITCQGRLPLVESGGTCEIGTLALRSMTAPIELGARRGAILRIGERVFVSQGATLVAHRSITIGDDCRIGDYAAIYDSDHHPVDDRAPARQAAVELGENVWVGRNVIILPGVRVGDHAVIAAGSVVTGDVASRTLVAGNPASEIRRLEAPDGWRRP